MLSKVAIAFKIIRSAEKYQSLIMTRKQMYVRWINELESTDIVSRSIVRVGAIMIFEENHVVNLHSKS